MKKESLSKTIFRRLLPFNIIMVIIFTVVPQMVSFHYFRSANDLDKEWMNMMTVRYFQKSIDGPILKEVVDFPNRYLSSLQSNEALTGPFSKDINKDTMSILNVGRRLEDIKSTLPFIHSIDLYYTANNMLFLDGRVCMLNNSNSCEIETRSNWFYSFQDSDKLIEWLPSETITESGDYEVATYVRSIPFFASKENREGILAVNINVSFLNKILTGLKPASEGMLMIVDEKGRLIAHNQLHNPFSEGLPQSLVSKLISSDSENLLKEKINDQTSILSYSSSELNGWRYVSVISMEEFNQTSRQLQGLLLIIMFVFLILNFVLAFWITRRAHKPISTRMTVLQDSLERYQPIVRHNYILGLLNGNSLNEGTTYQRKPFLDVESTSNSLFCFVLREMNNAGHKKEESAAVVYLLIEQLEETNEHFGVWAIEDEKDRILGIVHYDAQQIDNEEVSRIINDKVAAYLGSNYYLSVGESYSTSGENIAESYREAEETIHYSFLLPEGSMISIERLRGFNMKNTGSYFQTLNEIESGIRSGDEKKVLQLVDGLVVEIRSFHYTIQYCQHLLLDVVTAIRKAVENMGFNSTQIFGQDIREEYKLINHINEFQVWIHEVIHKAVDKVNERKQTVDQNLMNSILKIIDENLENQISLDLVASHANISTAYLSRMFKNMTGMNFSEYVTDLKLRRSVELLKEKKLTVQEISTLLGYNTTHYFIKLFKDKYGQTPKQYQIKPNSTYTETDSGFDSE